MTLYYINQEAINGLFKKLAIAESVNKIIFNYSENGYSFFLKRVASEILAICKPEFDSDIFKLELQWCLNQCLLNTELTSVYGKPKFAEKINILKLLSIIEEVVNDRQNERITEVN